MSILAAFVIMKDAIQCNPVSSIRLWLHRKILFGGINTFWAFRILFFCTLSLIIRIFTITCDVLQNYYDERHSPEKGCLFVSWNSWKSHFWVMYRCLTSCLSVGTKETWLNILWVSHLLKQDFTVFFHRLAELFSAGGDVSNELAFSRLYRSS